MRFHILLTRNLLMAPLLLSFSLASTGPALLSAAPFQVESAESETSAVQVHRDPHAELQEAHSLLQSGSYAEARSKLERLNQSDVSEIRAVAAFDLSRVAEETGNWKLARTILDAAVVRDPGRPELWGRLAEVQFLTGDYDPALKSANRAIELDDNQLRARLVLAKLHREAGQLKEALDGFVWFIRYYNRNDVEAADPLVLVAEGALEYARWKRSSSTYETVLNDLCPDALKADSQHWQAALLSGNLLLEKYNRSQCDLEFQAALKINPNAALAHAALARSSLQEHDHEDARSHAEAAIRVNPTQLDALLVLLDLELERNDIAAAGALLKQAQSVNPMDQRVLAREAAFLASRDGIPTVDHLKQLLELLTPTSPAATAGPPLENPSAFESIVLTLARRNPAPGQFLNDLGEFFESRKKYRAAELVYETAVTVMPQLSAPKNNLGLLYMRTGRVADAERMLDEAFQKDPFHVRISNMRKVLKVLNTYETIRTDHFLISVDSSEKMLGEYMAEYLEEVHAELTAEYGFSPDGRTRFEIYSGSKGQTAHAWFSARMVGLPWIQTIGASTGMIVALASPRGVPGSFNWARVLKHEYVHILTLQQTDFNIPHWYTEALAVRSEGMVMPDEWKRLLVERVPAGTAFTLKNVNDGFQRPEGPDDWSMAYCQSRLYARYLEETYGAEKLAQLIDCYCRGLSTDAAIAEVTGVTVVQFEAGYLKFLQQLVQQIQQSQSEPTIDVVESRKQHQENPKDAVAAGRYAYALLADGSPKEAREVAEKGHALDPLEPLCAATLAKLAISENDSPTAQNLLELVHNEVTPNPVVLALLAKLQIDADRPADAVVLYESGVENFPNEEEFLTGLSVALLDLKEDEKLIPVLEKLTEWDTTNIGARVKLAELALARGDYQRARHWGREVIYVDVDDPRGHLALGNAALGLSDLPRAQKEFNATLLLEADSIPARLGLARVAIAQNDPTTARRHLQSILDDTPNHPETQKLLDSLQSTN